MKDPWQVMAHRGHRAPAIVPSEPDMHWLFLAGKYLRKSFGHFDDMVGLADLPHDAFNYFSQASDDEPPNAGI